METRLEVVVYLVYIVFFVITWLLAMIPAVINAIGLARICQKLGAFKPVWCWVWALLCPSIAVLRAGDFAAERELPYISRKHFKGGFAAFMTCAVLTVLLIGIAIAAAVASLFDALSAFTVLFTVVMILLGICLFAASIWLTVLMYISYFRIFKLYVPTWGAWLMIAGMILLSQFSFLLLPVLSFLPMKE